jgi:hypothetical protein
VVAKIYPIVSARLEELRGNVSNENLQEYLALRALKQMNALAQAVSIVEQDKTIDSDTPTPATVLARIAIEGLIYTNYLVDDDAVNRATSFLCSEIMWREDYEDEAEGRPWRRAHGKCGSRKRHCAFGFRLPVSELHAGWCDKFERAYIQRDLAELRKEAGFSVTPPAGITTAADWRDFWKGLKPTGRALDKWQAMNGRWDQHRRYPFGFDPARASREGHLEVRLRSIVEEARSSGHPGVQDVMFEWIGGRDLDAFSLLAHFSPARVVIDPDAFGGLAAITHLFALWVVVRLLAKHFHWAQALQDAI